MKVIIAGTRSFNNYELLNTEIVKLMSQCYEQGYTWTIDCIVSGGANGADKLGERWAREHNIPCVIFSAKWDKYGKSAGPMRNIQMANYADALIAFWDSKSRGTQHMIDAMHERAKEVYVIEYNSL